MKRCRLAPAKGCANGSRPAPRTTRFLAGLLVLLGAAGAAAKGPVDLPVPGRYLLVLEDPPIARFGGDRAKGLAATSPTITGARGIDLDGPAVRSYRQHLADRRAALLARSKSADPSIAPAAGSIAEALARPIATLELVLNALVLDLDPAQAAWLEAQPGVRTVVPDGRERLETDVGPAWVGAEPVWNGDFGGAPNRGEGVVVGIIDQGVNWDHPAFADPSPDGYDHRNPLGRRLGLCSRATVPCNDKLIGVHDFTDEGTEGKDTDGHGTHVASIAIGNTRIANVEGITVELARPASGVAPRANVVSYKVCIEDDDDTPNQDEEGCVRSAIIQALEQAVTDGVDVLNYSIGGDPRDPWAASNLVAEAMLSTRAAGILTVTSAGNSGSGAGTISNPANAPWMLTVGNISHNRRFANALEALSGGAAPPPGDLAGVGLTAGFGPARIVHARDFGNALCGTGDPELQPQCNQHTGSSNPFPAGTFNGEIVVCDRGTYGRVEKGFNVRAAGAGGYVLANTDGQGESIVGDDHCLPAVHLGDRDGDELRAWLAAGGGDQSAMISGQFAQLDEALGDVVNAGSSRGPADFAPEALKPDLAAPGTDILGAGLLGDDTLFLTGTSMASPHVAGAAALLLGERPRLTPDQLHSILAGTAVNDGMREGDGTPAAAFDVGAGRLRVDRAVRAGLYLPLSTQELRAADPSSGGDPGALNLPAMIDDRCVSRCSFVRRVRDVAGGGDWEVEFSAPEGLAVDVRPRRFTLSRNQGLNLTITVDVSGSPQVVGTRAEGFVRLVSDDPALVDFRLPFSVFVDPGPIPDRFIISADGSYGSATVPVDGLIGLPEAAFEALGMAPLKTFERSLIQDPTRDDPYDDVLRGAFFDVVEVTRTGGIVFAETDPLDNGDLDLFVGLDSNGNSRPDADEELCASTTSGPAERCVIDDANPGTYWVLVQNWASRVPAGSDPVRVLFAAVDGDARGLTATGPGAVEPLEPFDLRLIWDEGRMERGEPWVGFVTPKTVRAAGAGELGAIPVFLTRTDPAGSGTSAEPDLESLAAYLLEPAATERVLLGSGEGHGRLFLDVPAGTDRLRFEVESGENVDIVVQRSAFTFEAPAVPLASGEVVASAVRPGGIEDLVIDDPEPGRYYAVLSNGGGVGSLEAALTTTLEGAPTGVLPVPGLYFNPARSGHGINLNRTDSQLVIQWYSYLEDGTPVWYLAQGPLPEAGDQWRAPLQHFSWDGESAAGVTVGAVSLTFLTASDFVFSFRVNGKTGTEPFQAIATSPGCDAQGVAAERTGLWFVPGQPGFGYSVLGLGETQVQIDYLFDGNGLPRWVLGQGPSDPAGFLPVAQFTGFCPTCAFVPVTSEIVGGNDYDFASEQTGAIATEIAFLDPVSGAWLAAGAIANLAPAFSCR